MKEARKKDSKKEMGMCTMPRNNKAIMQIINLIYLKRRKTSFISLKILKLVMKDPSFVSNGQD